jgi:GNAT superfamily N-acetyltransferase
MAPGDQAREAAAPSTSELTLVGAPVQLADGAQVRLRPIRRADTEQLQRGFDRLSSESRYRRFLCPMDTLSDQMAAYLTEVDHHDHEAIVALAEKSGEGVGVARYVRYRDRPEVAELAVTVADDWQNRGLGTLLVQVLSARARAEGITSFSALMLASNQEMLELLEGLGPVRVVDREQGTVEVEMPIPQVGLSPALRKLLRVSSQTDVVAPLRQPPPGRTRLASDRS